MYTKKYSPKESLEKIKLFMKYDSKKTLNENKVVLEQVDISTDIRDIEDELSSFNSDEGLIMKILQKYKSKSDFDKLVAAYKEKYNDDFGTALFDAIQSRDTIESQQLIDWAKSIGIDAQLNNIEGLWSFTPKSGDDSKPTTPKPPSPPKPIPEKLKDAEGVKKFQDWLDQNVTDWAKGYKDGKVNKGQQNPGFKSGGYGTFGPRTSKAWLTYKEQFLNKAQPSEKKPPQDEISGEEVVINVVDL